MHDNNAVTAARQTPPAVMSSRYPVDGISTASGSRTVVELHLTATAAGSCEPANKNKKGGYAVSWHGLAVSL